MFFIIAFIRWNSTFDGVDQIITYIHRNENNEIMPNVVTSKLDKLHKCCDFCGVQRFTPNEITFLKEYCKVSAILQLIITQFYINTTFTGYVSFSKGFRHFTERKKYVLGISVTDSYQPFRNH